MLKKSNISVKMIVIFLAFAIIHAGLDLNATESSYDSKLSSLIERYKEKKFKEIIPEIERLLGEIGEENNKIRGQFFILLGAAYEKTRNKDSAVENYLLGDMLLDQPVLQGIDFRKMEIYQSTFHGKIINGRRVFEKVGKRKRKKKFPYLAVLGAAAIALTVFLLIKKKTKEDPENFEKEQANLIFNSLEWVEIPAGEFLMGDHSGNGDADESPVHKVYLDSFKISKYEMTYKQWDMFMFVKPDKFNYYKGEGEDHPVTTVKRYEVDFFCDWIRDMTGHIVMLPTEAQWEKAARGTDQRIYPWGNNAPVCGKVNYNYCVGITSPVGSNSGDVSFYGIMDMGGNVSELVRDIYGEDYYSVSTYLNPSGPDGSYNDKNYKVFRGVDFQSSDVRASDRRSIHYRGFTDYVGFRVVWIE